MKKYMYSVLVLLVFMRSTQTIAGVVTGEIGAIVNGFYGLPIFLVQLKPGWTGGGCPNYTNSSAPIPLYFHESDTPTDTSQDPNPDLQRILWKRSISMAMIAYATGSTVQIWYNQGTCDAFSIVLTK